MMKREISSNEEAYKFTDVSYFSRFNRETYDTLEKVQPILVSDMLFENTGPSSLLTTSYFRWVYLTCERSCGWCLPDLDDKIVHGQNIA